jgi:transcriptional regulator with XRE-family HTH domain
MNTTPHILPDDLLTLRQELGLTQAQMAERLGMTWRNYHSLETGKRPATKTVALLLGYIRREFERGGELL